MKLVLPWYLWARYWYDEAAIALNDTNLVGVLMPRPLSVYIPRFHTGTHTCCRSIALIVFLEIRAYTTDWRSLLIKVETYGTNK
jgi:hypothetical protein